jgi:hypothetical protein
MLKKKFSLLIEKITLVVNIIFDCSEIILFFFLQLLLINFLNNNSSNFLDHDFLKKIIILFFVCFNLKDSEIGIIFRIELRNALLKKDKSKINDLYFETNDFYKKKVFFYTKLIISFVFLTFIFNSFFNLFNIRIFKDNIELVFFL